MGEAKNAKILLTEQNTAFVRKIAKEESRTANAVTNRIVAGEADSTRFLSEIFRWLNEGGTIRATMLGAAGVACGRLSGITVTGAKTALLVKMPRKK